MRRRPRSGAGRTCKCRPDLVGEVPDQSGEPEAPGEESTMDRTRISRRITRPLALMSTALMAGVLLSISVSALTQASQPANLQPAPNPPTPKPLQDDNVGPAPKSIGTDIPLT